jgi:CSLREA domain-containing protein
LAEKGVGEMVATRFCWTSARVLGCFLAVMVALSVALLDSRPAHAITLTVNSRADPGTGGCNSTQCTLREAINPSNGLPTTDTIEFAIPDDPTVPGIEVKTISPTSQLPTITDNVTIDGYTQQGAVENSATTNANNAVLTVEIRGSSAPQTADGLVVSGAGAANTTITGLVINRFGDDGLSINAPAAKVVGNFIGANAEGDEDFGNGGNGVRLLSGQNVVGRRDDATQNVISGNGANGISVEGADNIIANNHIGTDADAAEDLGNSLSGVFVDNVPDTLVGGSSRDGSLNIISGNDRHGVEVSNVGAEGARIVGNFIGLDRNGGGFSNVGNSQDGVRVSSTPNVEIGDAVTGGGNAISDNGRHGVEIVGTSSTNNVVLGNVIGTNKNGASDFGNAEDGVRIGNSSTVSIGDTVEGARNVISGNDANGVFISGTSSATGNRVQGNFIGVDRNGTTGFGNSEAGVRVETPGNLVGGAAPGARNVISDNGDAGVLVFGTGANGNVVQGNFVGMDANGTSNLGNLYGVFVSGASDTAIGGTFDAAANKIALNRSRGVAIVGDAATGNSILRNSIFGNGIPPGPSIDLEGGTEDDDGVTANDARDPDTGPNALQNFPVLTTASETRIEGRLNSRSGRTFIIQFYSNPPPISPLLVREGTTFLGQKTVQTNSEGRITFGFDTAVNTGELVTATATILVGNPSRPGNTSEFSATRAVQ